MTMINQRYTVIKEIGSGAAGTVYMVRDEMYGGITRALKVIRTDRLDAQAAAEMRKEFSLLRKLDHPNIVKVYDFGSVISSEKTGEKGSLYFTLDYVDGKDLFQITENASDEFIASLFMQIAYALEYIHAHTLIHFDIKPENIIVTEMIVGSDKVYIPKIIDFGLAAPAAGTMDKRVKGSIHYLAPELIAGKPFDHRADIYSLGVTIFQILTRSLPFESNDPVAVLKKHHFDTSSNISEKSPATSEDMAALVQAMMEKDPEKRMRNARAVAEALMPLIQHSPIVEQYSFNVFASGFAGRREELKKLLEHVRAGAAAMKNNAHSDHEKAIIVVGEQGSGKTPLIEEWRGVAQSEELCIIGTQCYLQTSPPLEPFRWLLHELRFVLLPRGPAAEKLLREFDSLFSALAYFPPDGKTVRSPLEFSSEEDQKEFLRLIVRVLKKAHAIHPFSVCIDDVHLADEMSLQLLRIMLGGNDHSLPGFVLTCESVDCIGTSLNADIGSFMVMTLGSYDDEKMKHFISRQLEHPSVSDELARLVYDKVGDSPYLLKDFLQQFRGLSPEKSVTEIMNALTHPAMSKEYLRPVNDIYEKRIRRCTKDERELLDYISCFRIPVNKQVLSQLVNYPVDRVTHVVTMLSMNGFLTLHEHGSSVSFSNAGFKQFVYHHPDSDKEHRQRRIAELLERNYADSLDAKAEAVGFHYKESGNHRKAYEYYVRAAEHAASAFSLQEGIVLLEEAMTLASDDEEFQSVLEKLARQNDLVEDYDKAETQYRTLLAQPNLTPDKQYRYLKALGTVQTRSGLHDQAAASFTEALKAAQTVREKMEIEDELADIDISQGRLSEARRRCMMVLKSMKKRPNDPDVSSLHTKLGIISFYETKYDEASVHFLKAYKILEQYGDKAKLIAPLLNLGNSYSVRQEYAKAQESWTLALGFAEEVGNYHQQGQICNNIGIVEYSQGHYDKALSNYEKGIDIFSRLGNAPGRALCLSNIGEVYLVRAEYEKALIAWEQCLELQNNISDAHGLAETYLHLSQLYLSFGYIEKVKEFLDKARSIIESTHLDAKWPIYYLYSASLEYAAGEYSEADKIALMAVEKFQSVRDEINFCGLLLLTGRIQRQLGRRKETAEYFTRALAKADALKLPQLKAETLLELGIESRMFNPSFEKKSLIYLKDAYALIENESVNEITWRLCYEIGKEYSIRGLEYKGREFFSKAKHTLLHLASQLTRPALQNRFWESDQRGAILKEIEAVITD